MAASLARAAIIFVERKGRPHAVHCLCKSCAQPEFLSAEAHLICAKSGIFFNRDVLSRSWQLSINLSLPRPAPSVTEPAGSKLRFPAKPAA